jgi:DNA-binding CsgD family transcriptional regulator/tetratricopeptide (TPR) repeat protein
MQNPAIGSPPFTAQTELPLVGRVADLGALRIALDDAVEGRGQVVFLSGESGVGKTRLVLALSREAASRNALIATGAAYAVEAGVPYGMISDALVPPLRTLPSTTLAVLARGAERELGLVLHGLDVRQGREELAAPAEADHKARLLWNFAQFIQRLAGRQPLLLILENAQWSDPSSIELVHFLSRQIRAAACLIIVTYADDEQELPPHLRAAERALLARGDATVRNLGPLTRHDVADILHRLFALEQAALDPLATRLHERSRGNPLFVDQMIRHLVESGRLRQDGHGWIVAEAGDLGLPSTIREALQARLAEVDSTARRVAEAAAVIGTRAALPLLQEVAGLQPLPFADAVDVLCARRVLREIGEGAMPQYEFIHPLMQLTVVAGVSAARRRALHLATAEAMERALGEAALTHSREIAQHLIEGHALGGDARALRFVAAAGRDALERHADAEALHLLSDALTIADRLSAAERDESVYRPLLEDLARARQRNGDRDGALTLWHQALALATAAGDDVLRGRLLRRIGLATAFAGRPTQGLHYLDQAEAVAVAGNRMELVVRNRVAKGMLLQSLGRADEAKRAIEEILPMATASEDPALQARVHRALMQLYGWTGPSATAREHGEASLAFATASGDRLLTWWAHWGMAVLQGLGGDSTLVATHRREAEAIAIELRSPLHQVAVAEIAIEHASAIGHWSEGLARADRAIPVARAIAPATLLPRLLVWTGLILMERDELARGHEYIEEAWRITRAEEVERSLREGATAVGGEVHNVILAHTGMAAYWLTQQEWRRALEYGQRGLAIADRFGYIVWSIHRLLPIILEAALWLQEYELAAQVCARFRQQAVLLGHKLGIAWANAADALRIRLDSRRPDAIPAMLAAAEELEAIPFPFHGARLRRKLAQVLAVDGDLDAARRELRRAHDVFVRLGAERELRATRSEMRTLGMRLPPRTATDGAHSLTGRELDIARLVARRLTNKEVAQQLDISARTVSTHLSNMFSKLDVDSRGALVDLLRAQPGFGEDGTR